MSSAVKKTSSFIAAVVIHELLSISLSFVTNPGISFGVQLPLVLLILVNLILFMLFYKRGDWGLFLISVGGIVNLIDRLRFGFVRDYWNFLGIGVYNNLNDWLIAIGLILFSLELIWKKLK